MILCIKMWLELNVSFDQTNRYNANIIPCYRRYWIGDFPLVFDSFNAIPKVWLEPNISIQSEDNSPHHLGRKDLIISETA